MNRVQSTAVHELGHAIVCAKLYRQPPKSMVVWADGRGHVQWSFEIQKKWWDATILAGGQVAHAIMSRVIKIEPKRDDDWKEIEKLGLLNNFSIYDKAFSILTSNIPILERYDEFTPRPGKKYRLLTARTLQFLVTEVK